MTRFVLVRENKADHQGQLSFQKISLVKIKLTLMARFILAYEKKAEALFAWAKTQRTIRVSFIVRKYHGSK